MKNLFIAFTCITLCIISCKKKTETEPDPPPATTGTTTSSAGTTTGATVNTGSLKLYLVDSTRLNTVSEAGIETTLLNAGNYIYFSPSVNDTKVVYYTHGGIYMADANGGNIQQVCSVSSSMQFYAIKAGINNKIYYSFFDNTTTRLYSVNTDGTGNVQIFSINDIFSEISPDGTHVSYFHNDTLIIINTIGPVIHHKVPLVSGSGTGSYLSKPSFSYDGQKVVASYGDGDTLKLKIFDIGTATVSTRTVTVIPNSAGNSTSIASIASDGDRIAITVSNGLARNVFCYIYKVSTNSLINSFIVNNDTGIKGLYAF